MKKIILIVAAFIGLNTASTVSANEGFYVGGLGAVNFLDIEKIHKVTFETDVGYAVGMTAGYASGCGLRGELEATFRRNEISKAKFPLGIHCKPHAHLQSWAFMANAIYELEICWNLKPFIGAGVGYTYRTDKISAKVKGSSPKVEELATEADQIAAKTQERSEISVSARRHSNGFAYQGIAGIAYPISNDIDIAVEYRLYVGGKHTIDHTLGMSLKKFF